MQSSFLLTRLTNKPTSVLTSEMLIIHQECFGVSTWHVLACTHTNTLAFTHRHAGHDTLILNISVTLPALISTFHLNNVITGATPLLTLCHYDNYILVSVYLGNLSGRGICMVFWTRWHHSIVAIRYNGNLYWAMEFLLKYTSRFFSSAALTFFFILSYEVILLFSLKTKTEPASACCRLPVKTSFRKLQRCTFYA